MTVLDIQNRVAGILSGVEELARGGCRILAEDTREVYDEVKACIAAGETAVVVTTPRLTRDGFRPGGIPMTLKIAVRCVEKPPAGAAVGSIRALDAAMAAAHALDGKEFCLDTVEQTADRSTGVISATAEFSTSLFITKN